MARVAKAVHFSVDPERFIVEFPDGTRIDLPTLWVLRTIRLYRLGQEGVISPEEWGTLADLYESEQEDNSC